MIEETDYNEIIDSLHKLADWIEKENNVHADSVPRRASYTISKLEEENNQFRLLLNKKDLTIMERVDRYIGYVKLYIYLTKTKWKKN